MTGRKIRTGTAGCTRVKRSSRPERNIGGDALRYSERRMCKPYPLSADESEYGKPDIRRGQARPRSYMR